jgi:hypothetical protein
MNTPDSVPLMQRPAIGATLCVLFTAVLVLVIEAVFVLSTGWAFGESILGGRISLRTALLFVLMLPTTAATMHRFVSRPAAQRFAFVICVAVFAALACWFSVEFSW